MGSSFSAGNARSVRQYAPCNVVADVRLFAGILSVHRVVLQRRKNKVQKLFFIIYNAICFDLLDDACRKMYNLVEVRRI